MSGMQPALTFIIIIPMIFWSLRVQQSTFSIGLELVVFVFQQIHYLQMIMSLKPGNTDDTLLHRNPHPKFPFFSTLTNF